MLVCRTICELIKGLVSGQQVHQEELLKNPLLGTNETLF